MAKRRRKFSPEFKAQVVLEVLSGVKTGAEACREYSIGSQLLTKWKAHFPENAARIFDYGSPPHSEDQTRMAELERPVGRQAPEIQLLRKASSILRSHPSGIERSTTLERPLAELTSGAFILETFGVDHRASPMPASIDV